MLESEDIKHKAQQNIGLTDPPTKGNWVLNRQSFVNMELQPEKGLTATKGGNKMAYGKSTGVL